MILKNASSGKYKYMYILLVNKNKNIFKTGRASVIKERLRGYETGRDKHPDIKFILLVDDPKAVENCSKIFLKRHKYKGDGNRELYKVNIDVIKQVLFDCSSLNRKFNKANKKINKIESDVDAYVIYDENVNHIEYIDKKNNVIGYEKVYPNKKSIAYGSIPGIDKVHNAKL